MNDKYELKKESVIILDGSDKAKKDLSEYEKHLESILNENE